MKGSFAQQRKDSSTTPRVALLIETSREFGRGLLRGIHAYEQRHGPWRLYVMPGDLNQIVPTIRAWHATGIIARVTTHALEHVIRTSGLPFIGVSLTREQVAPDGPLAGASNLRAATKPIVKFAVEHLLEQGFRQFAFVGEASGPEWSRFREHAVIQVLAMHGLECQIYPRPPVSDSGWVRESRRLARWLSSLHCPIGIITSTDLRGREVISACHEARLRVPEDAAVIGVDNDPLLSELCDPPLTSVALDLQGAGWRAADMLSKLMRGRQIASKTILIKPTHVVARLSTSVAQASDPHVAAARHFILREARRLIQVDDVAMHVGVSRRTLEMRFREATGRSVLQELRRVRLQHAGTLLRETNMSVSDIAAASGFASANYLAKVFRHIHGVSPKAFQARTNRKKMADF